MSLVAPIRILQILYFTHTKYSSTVMFLWKQWALFSFCTTTENFLNYTLIHPFENSFIKDFSCIFLGTKVKSIVLNCTLKCRQFLVSKYLWIKVVHYSKNRIFECNFQVLDFYIFIIFSYLRNVCQAIFNIILFTGEKIVF